MLNITHYQGVFLYAVKINKQYKTKGCLCVSLCVCVCVCVCVWTNDF